MIVTLYKYFFRLLLLAACVSVFYIQSAFATEGAADYDRLLARYTAVDTTGATVVDYAAWRASDEDLAALGAYIDHLVQLDPTSLKSRDDQFAAWANLYNALTLKVVLDAYPVDSIRQIKSGLVSSGPWKRKLVEIGDRKLSLDDIEHRILRVQWDDPRVHYAVNCASIGCPDLRRSAWVGETLDADLNAAARTYINHPRGVTVLADGRLRVSKIYKWFREDFGGSEKGVLEHLARYADDETATALKNSAEIQGYSYDWSLNAQKGPST